MCQPGDHALVEQAALTGVRPAGQQAPQRAPSKSPRRSGPRCAIRGGRASPSATQSIIPKRLGRRSARMSVAEHEGGACSWSACGWDRLRVRPVLVDDHAPRHAEMASRTPPSSSRSSGISPAFRRAVTVRRPGAARNRGERPSGRARRRAPSMRLPHARASPRTVSDLGKFGHAQPTIFAKSNPTGLRTALAGAHASDYVGAMVERPSLRGGQRCSGSRGRRRSMHSACSGSSRPSPGVRTLIERLMTGLTAVGRRYRLAGARGRWSVIAHLGRHRRYRAAILRRARRRVTGLWIPSRRDA